ncbi:helix-turn-helix domain-containing protein [Micromonospora kangleipakensis]|nr:helix-turn-helix domain-containing protein [Micromonospora kangleipakensis]
MTIEDLSEASGVSGRAISDMERGHSRAPQERTLAALADALKLSDGDRAGLVELARSGRSESRVGRPRVGELPRGISDFVGRARELELLRRHALAASVGGPTLVAVVHGQPGLGKTAFAVSAAEQLREVFPDGQFYLDLRGTDPVPTPVGEALKRLLRALDVNPAGSPTMSRSGPASCGRFCRHWGVGASERWGYRSVRLRVRLMAGTTASARA